MRPWHLILASGLLATASCTHDWDGLDPRLGPAEGEGGQGGVAGQGGSATVGQGGEAGQGGFGGQGGLGGSGGATGGGGAAPLGPWGTPTPFLHNVASAFDDDPSFTADGLELFFNSNRDGANAVWVCSRDSRADAWGPPELVAELEAVFFETNPVVAPDGLTIWLSAREQVDSTLDRDIYVATRPDRQSPWSSPVAVAELNDPIADDIPGSVTGDQLTMVLERDDDLYLSSRPSLSSPWGAPAAIAELNTAMDDRQAWIAPDGLALHFDREGAILDTSRADLASPWAAPTIIAELDSSDLESDPWLSPDKRYMMFTRSTDGMTGDIYETTR